MRTQREEAIPLKKEEHAKRVVGPEAHFNDTFALFGALAAHTESLELATGIFIAPLRHPLLVVREALTLAEISQGRFDLGLGAGWLEEELDALGSPYAKRAKVLDETISMLRKAVQVRAFYHRGRGFFLRARAF